MLLPRPVTAFKISKSGESWELRQQSLQPSGTRAQDFGGGGEAVRGWGDGQGQKGGGHTHVPENASEKSPPPTVLHVLGWQPMEVKVSLQKRQWLMTEHL